MLWREHLLFTGSDGTDNMETVNIIGAGLAGLSAALTLANENKKCRLISLQPSERAQSVMAEGGINAVLNTMGESDSVSEHFEDTMRGGAFLADPKAVEGLTENGPRIVRQLFALGVPFAMKGNDILQRNFGGQKKKRTAFAKSSTGKVIMSALIDEVRKYEAAGFVERQNHHEALEPVIRDGVCGGVLVRDSFTGEVSFLKGAVIAATGGLNGLFEGLTTGSTANSGDFTAACFACGTKLSNLEMIQYHPTTVAIPGKRLLISEAARGEGGRLFVERDGKAWYFMETIFPESGNLAPRDAISRTMTLVAGKDGCDDIIYLDMTGLSQEIWDTKLSDMRDEIKEYLNTDPFKRPVPVSPGIHFFMGGLLTDINHRTNIKNLYAAGECACQYHGANRLGGNSMLAAIYGGRVAAESLIKDSPVSAEVESGLSRPEAYEVRNDFAYNLSEILKEGLGIIRSGDVMEEAVRKLRRLREDSNPKELKKIQLAEAMLLSALERKESRGAHIRKDYPGRDDMNFKKTTTAYLGDGKIQIEFKDIGQI